MLVYQVNSFKLHNGYVFYTLSYAVMLGWRLLMFPDESDFSSRRREEESANSLDPYYCLL